jgi:hypothetical protein
MKQTPGQKIAETVYYLDDGETYASVEGKRAALANQIDTAIAKEVTRATPDARPKARMTDAQLARAYHDSAKQTNEIMNEQKDRRAKAKQQPTKGAKKK